MLCPDLREMPQGTEMQAYRPCPLVQSIHNMRLLSFNVQLSDVFESPSKQHHLDLQMEMSYLLEFIG